MCRSVHLGGVEYNPTMELLSAILRRSSSSQASTNSLSLNITPTLAATESDYSKDRICVDPHSCLSVILFLCRQKRIVSITSQGLHGDYFIITQPCWFTHPSKSQCYRRSLVRRGFLHESLTTGSLKISKEPRDDRV